MIKSPYATQLTRQIQEGHPNPSRDMTNRKPPKKSKNKTSEDKNKK